MSKGTTKTKSHPPMKGSRSGPGLKSGLNMADTGSVVHSVKGAVAFGRMTQPSHKRVRGG